MSILCARIVVALCAAMLSSRSMAADVVDTCGQSVSGIAVLAADLDCTAAADKNIYVEGTLDLAGHTLAANLRCGPDDASGYYPHCSIEGPGTVNGCITSRGVVMISGATMSYTSTALCEGYPNVEEPPSAVVAYSITITDSSISGYPTLGFFGHSGFSTISASSGNALVMRSTISSTSQLAVQASKGVRIKDSTIVGSVFAEENVRVVRSDISGAAQDNAVRTRGETGGAVLLKQSTVSGNNGPGIGSGRIRLIDSHVFENCADPQFINCTDLYSTGRTPRLNDSDCETSFCTTVDGPCDVCSED
jgi:hypothetical protein